MSSILLSASAAETWSTTANSVHFHSAFALESWHLLCLMLVAKLFSVLCQPGKENRPRSRDLGALLLESSTFLPAEESDSGAIKYCKGTSDLTSPS